MRTIGSRTRLLRDLFAACGAAYPLMVFAGSLSLAFAIDQNLPIHLYGMLAAVALAGFVFLITPLAFVAWLAPCARWASRNGASLVSVLRWNAVSYAALCAAPVAQLLLPRADHSTGAAAAAIGFTAGMLYTAARASAGFRTTLLIFCLSRAVVFIAVALTAILFGDRGSVRSANFGHAFLDALSRWDGAHYVAIAERGYQGANLAFFPLYPLLIRLTAPIFGSAPIAAIAIANVAFFVALDLLRRLTLAYFGSEVAARTIYLQATFPCAVFFSAAYSESLFLALSVGTFYFLWQRHWGAAGLLGGLAALTRVEGVLLVVPYAMEALTAYRAMPRGRSHPVTLRSAPVAGAVMILFGLLTFMLLSTLLSGDPLYFAHVQQHWERHPAWPWQSVWRTYRMIATSRNLPTIAVQATELSFVTFALVTMAAGAKQIPSSFTVYALLSLLLPLFTGSLMSSQRFSLVLFPIFMTLGIVTQKTDFDLTVRTCFLALLGTFTVFFAAGFWIG